MHTAIAKAAAILSDGRGRKAAGWIAVAVLSPLIVLAALILAFLSGASESGASLVDLCFYGGAVPNNVTAEYREKILDVRESFAEIDAYAAGLAADGTEIDANAVKAVFFVLYFGGGAPPLTETAGFADCFAGAGLEAAYSNIEAAFGITLAESDRAGVSETYRRVTLGGGVAFSGAAERGAGVKDTTLDASNFVKPGEKNNLDLVSYVTCAWENGWGYVWGTVGGVMTEQALQSQIALYPDEAGGYEDFIRSKWLNGRTADCAGLIKGYGWLNPATLKFVYDTAKFPDNGANSMYNSAGVKGEIAEMPDVPGLGVWHKGHIGVYVGDGEVIEALGTKHGVVKTKLADRNWTRWLEIPNVTYY